MAEYFTREQLDQIIKKSTLEVTQRAKDQSPASPNPTESLSDDPNIIRDEPDSPEIMPDDPVLHPDRDEQPTSPFSGIPLPVGSLGRQFDPDPLLPHHEDNENKYVSMSRLRMPIKWESLFLLPNLESRIALYFAEIDTYALAMQMSLLELIRPLEVRINHLIRTYDEPQTWDMQTIH